MRVSSGLWFVVGAMCAGGVALAEAQARRVLNESPEIKAAVARVKPDMLKQDPALADCAPKRHQTGEAGDWACKVGALKIAAAAEKIDPELPLDKNKGLLKRAKLVSLALDAADAIGFYKPQGGVSEELPGFQVKAQWQACEAAQDFFAAMLDIPESKPVGKLLETGLPAKDAPRLDKPLKRVTCDCYERTLAIGRAGFLNEQRESGLQRAKKQIYAVGCNLNTTGRETSLSGLKRERSDLDLSSHGGSARGADADRDEAVRVAERRKKELTLCIDEKAKGAGADDKMSRCSCPLMQRWRFPKREVDAPLKISVLVAEKLTPISLEINQRGIVEKCYSGATPPAAAEPK